MKVTFMLGNGFDKSIDMPTSYGEFYGWYLKQPSDLDAVGMLKEVIRESIKNGDEYWSDFELALGQFTNSFSDKKTFIKCFQSARNSLIEYLNMVYNTSKESNIDFIKSAAYGLAELSSQYYRDLPEDIKKKFDLVENREKLIFRYISFNYTPFLQEGNEDIKSFIDHFSIQKHQERKYIIADYLNIHGLLENYPILGVNDSSQIANETFRTDQEILNLMVKEEIDKLVGGKWRKQALDMIKDSDVIYVFGMSLGDTDIFWRQALAKWFESDERHKLIIHCYLDQEEDIAHKEREIFDKISCYISDEKKKAEIIIDNAYKEMTARFVRAETKSVINMGCTANLTVAKTIPLSIGGTGFQFIYEIIIKNDIYLNVDGYNSRIFYDEEENIECILCSAQKGELICEAKKLIFVLGIFDTAISAQNYADTFIFSLKYYLSRSGCSYSIKGRIKDLSTLETRSYCFANLSLLAPFSFDSLLPVGRENIKTVIGLLEKAEMIPVTELRFFVYIVVLETLLDDNESKELKSSSFIKLLDDVIEYINKTESPKGDRDSLLTMLDNYRYIGSRKAVINQINKYFPKKTINCDGKSRKYKEIYHVCYRMRNNFVHNGIVDKKISAYISAIKKIAYDMVYAYANTPDS